jgi:hypothetical protein
MFKRKASLLKLVIVALAFVLPQVSSDLAVSAQNGSEPGVARTEEVEMIVRAGFGRVDVNRNVGTWVPFRISVSNQGPPITGRLVVRAESDPNPSTQLREFVKPVQLPTGSNQLHEMAVFLNSGHKEPEIILMNGEDPVASTTVKVERNYGLNDELEIAVVDTEQTTLNSISSKEIFRQANRPPFKSAASQAAQPQPPAPPSAGPQQPPPTQPGQLPPPPPRRRTYRWSASNQQGPSAHPVVIPSEDLPRDFVSYDALDVVVLGDAPLSQLTGEQAESLKMWVASGGMLVVTAAADLAGLRSSGLDAILPIDARGTVTVPDLPELTETYGRFESSDPALIISAVARAGAATLIGTPTRPIVAERFYGSGLVRFVAINPKLNPYRGWGAGKDLWNDLLLPAAEAKPRQVNWITLGSRGNSTSSNWGIQNFLFRLAEIEPPSPKYFVLFLLFYILLVGPINYLFLRWMGKLDRAWLTIPAVVLVFTGVSVAVAEISRGADSVAADVSLVELHQREGLVKKVGAMLIMPTSKGVEEMAFVGRNSFVNDTIDDNFPSSATSSDAIKSEREADRFLMNVPMNTWTAIMFRYRSADESGERLVSTSLNGSAKTVTVKNLGDTPITSGVYISREGISEVFDLDAGGEKEISLSAPPVSKFSDWYIGKLGYTGKDAEVFSDIASILDREIGGQRVFLSGFFDNAQMTNTWMHLEQPLFLGFVEKSPAEMSFKNSSKRRSKSFYVVHL